ncbi:hypothetical protein LOAG_12532 [Loa loa]|uniref:Secreted protein n=1 Tax=Loa loa TaxID=7209 RepID=A0A1I7W4K4_LOALO|nr:hypothetical protein LOAG_12532 [Loa loa]EFO15977.2 hypothetical protein LOAG_12532 [Loa loa]
MYRTVVLSFLLQLLLWKQLHLCHAAKTAKSNVVQYAPKGIFAVPLCCEEPWDFDGDAGRCMLDMVYTFPFGRSVSRDGN